MILSAQAARELEEIRQRELREIDTPEVIRQIFGNGDRVLQFPRLTHSGLVEQQAWFTKLSKRTDHP